MHLRFYNPEAQEHGRLAYPVLVEAGILPGPMVRHRVAKGETLSHLARRYRTSPAVIRSANGIRGSALRAGRTYLIPVRRIPSPGEPVVIPPRRLPPDASVQAGLASASPD
jgi:LysM repeat protein